MAAKKLAVIADPYTAALYKLLGALVYPAEDREEALKALRETLARTDIGVVLLAAEYYGQLEEEVRKASTERKDLVISILPTIRERGKPMNVQQELLRALGMA